MGAGMRKMQGVSDGTPSLVGVCRSLLGRGSEPKSIHGQTARAQQGASFMIKLHTHNTPCPPWKRRSGEWTISMLLVWPAFS